MAPVGNRFNTELLSVGCLTITKFDLVISELLRSKDQFVIFNPLSYCFEEVIGFELKASFASRPVSRLIR